MTWRDYILEWKPENEWQPLINKWQKENPNPANWFTLWVWPEDEDKAQTETLKKFLADKNIQYTERIDYWGEYPAAIDSVVYCIGDINITNAEAEFAKITVDNKMVYYEGVPVALIGEYIDERMGL